MERCPMNQHPPYLPQGVTLPHPVYFPIFLSSHLVNIGVGLVDICQRELKGIQQYTESTKPDHSHDPWDFLVCAQCGTSIICVTAVRDW